MRSGTLAVILFFVFVIATGVALHANSARGETAVCAQDANALRICTSLKVDSEIASGNEAAVLARKALYALRNGENPEVFVPLLAGWLVDADLTLAEFGVTKTGLAAAVNRYYAAEKRHLNVYMMAERGETEKAFREVRLIYEKERAMLTVVERDFAPYPPRLIGSRSR